MFSKWRVNDAIGTEFWGSKEGVFIE